MSFRVSLVLVTLTLRKNFVRLLTKINYQELHPDVNKSPKAGQEFLKVRDAYTALRPENRKKFEFAEDL